MSQSEKTGILYDQIIQRVIEDSRERFEAEGADMQVLGELQKVSYSCVHIPPVHCKYPSRFSGLARTLRIDLLPNDVLTVYSSGGRSSSSLA